MSSGSSWNAARESDSPQERTGWLQDKLSHASRIHIVDFQAHLDAARRPIDTYATWGAAYQIMDGLCSGDGFWYFQPWLIGQGREWYEHARSPAGDQSGSAIRAPSLLWSGRPLPRSGVPWPTARPSAPVRWRLVSVTLRYEAEGAGNQGQRRIAGSVWLRGSSTWRMAARR